MTNLVSIVKMPEESFDTVTPILSIVVPTLGRITGLKRMLNSIVFHSEKKNLLKTELIVFINKMPGEAVKIDNIRDYVLTMYDYFHTIKIIEANKFYMTAEESACAAISYAIGDFLLLTGDQRIFLADGLSELWKFIESPATDCAFFNAFLSENTGHTNAISAAHFNKMELKISYKDFIQRTGINFLGTGMGNWVVKRKYMNLNTWNHIIKKCGPHFSHVATLLAELGEENITAYATHLIIYETKAYHSGDGSEWDTYAKLSCTYRYYAWTFGLVRQFEYLVDRGIYTYSDIRRMMCAEARVLYRQIDDILNATTMQIWQGYLYKKDMISKAELDEILVFLMKVCPERATVIGLIEKLYKQSTQLGVRNFVKCTQKLKQAIQLDREGIKLSSLIIGQVGQKFIRLHPRGYLISDITENDNFLAAYVLMDAPENSKFWNLVEKKELSIYDITIFQHNFLPHSHYEYFQMITIDSLFPQHLEKPVSHKRALLNKLKNISRTFKIDILVINLLLFTPKFVFQYLNKFTRI